MMFPLTVPKEYGSFGGGGGLLGHRRQRAVRRAEREALTLDAVAARVSRRRVLQPRCVGSGSSEMLRLAMFVGGWRLEPSVSLNCGTVERPGETEALRALLKSSDVYAEEGRRAVRPFDVDKVKLLQGTVTPKDSRLMFPAHARAVLDAPEKIHRAALGGARRRAAHSAVLGCHVGPRPQEQPSAALGVAAAAG